MNDQIEQTLVLIKPDAFERGLIGDILQRFEKVGLTIKAIKGMQASESIASDHYGDLDVRYSPRIKNDMVAFLTSGPMLAVVLEGIGAIAQVRKMVGATYPNEALPGTIRGDHSHVSKDYANAQKIAVKNLVHASSSIDDAKREIGIWFDTAEFLQYEPIHDRHTKR